MKRGFIIFSATVFLLISGKNSFGEKPAAIEKPVVTEKADKKTTPEPLTLEDFVVTGDGEDRHELSEIPVALSIIDELELKRKVTTTVGDLLRDVPGVEILDTGVLAGQKRVMIRGESGSRVLLLVDGQKITEQKSMGGAALLMDMNAIERIEVTKGPATVLHGSEGLGGVINVITKKAGDRAFQLETSNSFNTNTDGWNNYISVYGGGEDLHGFGYRLSVANSDHGNQRGPDREVMERTNFHNSERTAYLDYTFKDIKLGFSFSDYTSDTNAYAFRTKPYDFNTPPLDWNVPTYIPPGEFNLYMEFKQMGLPEWNRGKTATFAEWNNISNSLFKIRVDAYQQDTFKHFVVEPFVAPGGWYPGNTEWMESMFFANGDARTWPNRTSFLSFAMHTKNTMDTKNVTARTEWILFDSHYLVFGAEFHLDELGAVTTQQYTPGSVATMMSYGKKYEWIQADRESRDVFIQNEWNIAPDWLATFGLRYSETRSRLTHDRSLHQYDLDHVLYAIATPGQRWFLNHLAGRPDEVIINKPDTTNNYATNYSISLVNNSFDNLTLRAHHGTAHALPSLASLFIWSSQSGITVAPNPDLKPETASSFEIGARYSTGNWDMDLTLYQSTTDDYLTIVDLPASAISGAGRIRMNLNSAETRGVEFSASYTFQPWQLTPYVVGYYIEREFQYSAMTITDGGGNPLTFGEDFTTNDTGLPRLQGRFGVRYEHQFGVDKRFWLDLYGRAAKSAYAVSSRRVGGPGTDRVVTTDVSGWETANFATGWHLPLFLENSSVDLSFAVNNIFDRRYKTAHQEIMDSPGRHFTFKLGMEF